MKVDHRRNSSSSAADTPVPPGHGGHFQAVPLPRPKLTAGLSVSRALQLRRTTRELSDRRLSLQTISDLLWAACGVNRKNGPFNLPGRTAASASNSQEVDVYLVVEEGVYIYEAIGHTLEPVVAGDLRAAAIGRGQTVFAEHAPLHLVYVADVDRLVNTAGYQEPGLLVPDIQKSYYYVDTGLIAGNVYLFAASRGLAAWFHNCNRTALAERLKLRPDQRVLFAQTVGYPVNKHRR